MSLRKQLLALAACILLCSLPAIAQEGGYWRPASSTAKSITGDIFFSANAISINYANFPLAEIRTLTPDELMAAFDADAGSGSGHLYRLNIPPARKFEHHNTLCGSDATEWMATFVSGNTLQMTLFSGDKMPVLTIDALANSNNRCGTFSYTR